MNGGVCRQAARGERPSVRVLAKKARKNKRGKKKKKYDDSND